MRFKLYSILFLFSFVLIACGGEAKKAGDATAAAKTPPTQAATTTGSQGSQNAVPLESIPKDIVMNLWDKCTYIDYIFHSLPFSMSQDEQESIRANLNYIATIPQTNIPTDCKPIARQMFHIGGDIVLECDVYLSETCQFYVFVENEKPIYANKMTPDGLKFFSTMFSKVDQQKGN